jgi:hypothetical protein
MGLLVDMVASPVPVSAVVLRDCPAARGWTRQAGRAPLGPIVLALTKGRGPQVGLWAQPRRHLGDDRPIRRKG